MAEIAEFRKAMSAAPEEGLVMVVGRDRPAIECEVLPFLIQGPIAAHSTRVKVRGREVHLLAANSTTIEVRLRGANLALVYVDFLPGRRGDELEKLLRLRCRVPGAKMLRWTGDEIDLATGCRSSSPREVRA